MVKEKNPYILEETQVRNVSVTKHYDPPGLGIISGKCWEAIVQNNYHLVYNKNQPVRTCISPA